jgi:hypothetical protein
LRLPQINAPLGHQIIVVLITTRVLILDHAVDGLQQLHAEVVIDRLRMLRGVVGVVEIAPYDDAVAVDRQVLQVFDESFKTALPQQVEFNV